MNADSERWILYPGILLLTVATIIIAAYSISWPEGYDHQPFVPPMLALELPQSVEEFQAVTAPAQDDIRRAQYADFVFIFFYVVFFFSFAIAVEVEDDRTTSTILIFTLVTMAMDIGENIFILRAMNDVAAGTLRTILIFGCAKWIAFFAIALAMSEVLFDSGGLWRIAGFVMRIAALVGMFGAAASFLSASARPLVAVSSLEAALTIGAIIVATAWQVVARNAAGAPAVTT